MSEIGSVALANLAAARALVDTFVAAGLRHVVLCPGSRSGPLAVAVDERKDLETFVLIDERSAGYFALGLARESAKPTLVICTSGTAAANLVPAAAEAFFGEVPLLVVTADRPPEARDFAAPQTIRQVGLFSGHTRASMDVATPGVDAPALAYYRAIAAQAFALATGIARGPVHLNVPFREPLLPMPLPPRLHGSEAPRSVTGSATLDTAELEALAARARGIERGLLVCGPSSAARETAPALVELAHALGWPTLADPLSGLRACERTELTIVDAYDVVLRGTELRREAKPDLVLRFGGVPSSKSLQQALVDWGCPQILFATPGTWPDPSWSATDVVACDTLTTANALARRVEAHPGARPAPWLDFWTNASSAAREAMDARLDQSPELFEGRVARDLARRLPEGGIFFVGNSMPIRDVDTFCSHVPRGASVLANRGANGIDGVLSSALGAAAASSRPTVLLLGDLSFLHDAGALQLARRLDIPLLTVVINNDGGGIFHMLPAAGLGETFERCFATPHGLELAEGVPPGGVVELRRATSADELERAVGEWLAEPRPMVVEVPCDRHHGVAMRAAIVDASITAAERARKPTR